MQSIQKYAYIVLALTIAAAAAVVYISSRSSQMALDSLQSSQNDVVFQSAPADPKNGTYTINGVEFKLVSGEAEKETIPGSASKDIVKIFGEPVYGDINADGKDEAVMFLSMQSGGSGTFFYAVASYKTDNAYIGGNTVFLGDRIVPKNININTDGEISVSYIGRREGEPMTAIPSMNTGKHLVVENGVLMERTK